MTTEMQDGKTVVAGGGETAPAPGSSEALDAILDKHEEAAASPGSEEGAAKKEEATPPAKKEGEEAGAKKEDATPPVKKEEASKSPEEIEAEEEESLQKLPEEQKKRQNEIFARRRLREKELREENARLKTELEKKSGDAPPSGREKEGAPGGEKPANKGGDGPKTLEDYRTLYAVLADARRVLDGDDVKGWTIEQAEKMAELGRQVRAQLQDPVLAMQIHDAAAQGAFGKQSDMIREMVAQDVPLIRERKQMRDAVNAQEMEKAKEFTSGVTRRIESALKSDPIFEELKDEKSELAQVARAWIAKNIIDVKTQKAGIRMGEMGTDEGAAEVMADLANALKAKKYELVSPEHKALKTRVRQFEAPLGAGGSPPAGGGGTPKPGSSEALGAILNKYNVGNDD